MANNWTSHRARFQGSLGGVSVDDFKGLDYELDKIEDRMRLIRQKVKEIEPFTNEYFFQKEKDNGESDNLTTDSDIKEYFNYSPNGKEELSMDINICKYIEQYGSYLLNSKDLPKERQQEYTILNEDDFKKFLTKEMSSSNGSDATVVMDTRPSNDYTNMTLKITKKDMDVSLQNNKYGIRPKDKKLESVLNDYETLKIHLKKELRKIQLGEPAKYDLIKIRTLLADINDDMLMCKLMILGIRSQAKRLGDESPTNDFSTLDYSNPLHVKAIIRNCKMTTPRPDDMASHIGYDLMVAVNKLRKNKRIDELDVEIIECYNSGNYSIRDIAEELNKGKSTIEQRLNKICKRLSEVM